MKKTILILGMGAQGSVVAKWMNQESNVQQIICADYDLQAIKSNIKLLDKAVAVQVDASSLESILAATKHAKQPIDLLVNALPLDFGKNALEAALKLKANYQDFASPEKIGKTWLKGIALMLSSYNKRFKAINRLAITGTGSAPGILCLATRKAVERLDTCETIYNICYEGVEAKQFQPFWFSPITALGDMEEDAYAFINGKITRTKPFSLPIYRKYEYMDKEIRFVEHAHDEPVFYGLHAKQLYKGLKNACFKYGGVGIEFANKLYDAGLLSRKPEQYNGKTIVPFEYVLSHLPPAPKTANEIKKILGNGLVSDTGCLTAEAIGKKNGKRTLVEVHVFAPGIVDSFKKSQMTAEQYLTGQSGAMYTQLFVRNLYTQTGLITSDALTIQEINIYLKEIAKYDIMLKTIVKQIKN